MLPAILWRCFPFWNTVPTLPLFTGRCNRLSNLDKWPVIRFRLTGLYFQTEREFRSPLCKVLKHAERGQDGSKQRIQLPSRAGICKVGTRLVPKIMEIAGSILDLIGSLSNILLLLFRRRPVVGKSTRSISSRQLTSKAHFKQNNAAPNNGQDKE